MLNSFHDQIRFVDGRYEVSLPWKDPDQVIPDNYSTNYACNACGDYCDVFERNQTSSESIIPLFVRRESRA